MDKLERSLVKDSSVADIILTTVHGAKGKTYSTQTMIANDLIDIMELYMKKGTDEFDLDDVLEELNIWYVANSRSKGDVQLNISTLMFYDTVIKESNNIKKAIDNLVSKEIKEVKNLIFE